VSKESSESKRRLFLAMLEQEPLVKLVFDSRRPGVFVPESCQQKSCVTFDYGLNMSRPIPDLQVNELGVFATLSFDSRPEATFIPWPAVYSMGDQRMEGMVWHDDVPADVQTHLTKTPIPERLKPALRPVPAESPEVLYEAAPGAVVERPALRLLQGGKA
jgi:hypothetical protein